MKATALGLAVMLTGGAVATASDSVGRFPDLPGNEAPANHFSDGRTNPYADIIVDTKPDGLFSIGPTKFRWRGMQTPLVGQIRWVIQEARGTREPDPRKVPLR